MKRYYNIPILFLVNSKILLPLRKFFGELLYYILLFRKGEIIYYHDSDYPYSNRSKIFDLIQKIKKEKRIFLNFTEAYNIAMTVQRTKKIQGNIAEVGVFRGGSAKLICEVKGDKSLYLFDTFEGLPEVSDIDAPFYKGKYSANFENVKTYLSKYKNVHIYKGMFPSTADSIKNKSFSFIHLDVDIYKSTLDCLKFFYPRMSKGGIIISHDYVSAPGVKKAFDEFFNGKKESILQLGGGFQCLVVKL